MEALLQEEVEAVVAENSSKKMEVLLPVVSVTTLPAIESNLEKIGKYMETYLEKFKFIVDEDGIATAKEKASELKSMYDQLAELREEKIAEVSGPIKDFENKSKEIENKIKNVRKSLMEQLEKFTAEKLLLIKGLLKKEVEDLYIAYKIEDEFKKVVFDDLVKLGSMTKAGKLSQAKAGKFIAQRVKDCKELQDKITLRLQALEGTCLKDGLQVALQRHNIEHFLFDDDYDAKLEKLIQQQLDQQTRLKLQLEKQAKNKAEREAKIKAELEAKKIAEENAKVQAQVQEQIKESTPVTIVEKTKATTSTPSTPKLKGDTEYVITVTMKVSTVDVTEDSMAGLTMARFIKCGFKSVEKIDVEKIQSGGLKNGSLF